MGELNMRANSPLFCIRSWEFNLGVLLGKPVVDRRKDLRHYVLHDKVCE